MKAVEDPALLEDLKKRRWEVDAISGEEMAKLAKEVVPSRRRSSRMKKLLGG